MTLTNRDLQQIRGVVKDETEPISKDIKTIKRDVGNLKKDVSKLKKDVDVLIVRSDREETLLKKRVVRIEEHIGLPSKN